MTGLFSLAPFESCLYAALSWGLAPCGRCLAPYGRGLNAALSGSFQSPSLRFAVLGSCSLRSLSFSLELNAIR